MPNLRPESWYVGILLLCVPLQYLFVQYWGNNAASRTHALKQLYDDFREFQTKWKSWKKWLQEVVAEMRRSDKRKAETSPESLYHDTSDDPMGESPAVEVMKYKQTHGYYSGSPRPRDPRPSHIKYRVGQVMQHKLLDYRGVIIGWDEVAKAPEEWIKEMYGKNGLHWRKLPHYAILVDTRDKHEPQITYVPEENIKIRTSVKIINPKIDEYFEKFDGVEYVPRPWLKALYPND